MAALTLEQKIKVYYKVAGYLAFLTAIELVFVFSPLPSLIQTILICFASLLKAVCVGWWYMHLNHETKSLKALAILPFIIAFFYASYLVVDAKFTWNRSAKPYMNPPPRIFGGAFDHPVPESSPPIEQKLDTPTPPPVEGIEPPAGELKKDSLEAPADEWS